MRLRWRLLLSPAWCSGEDKLNGSAGHFARDGNFPACRQLELVRDTLMDDARKRVDSLGEEATQNESLGAALKQAYAARFANGATSAPARAQQPQQSSAGPLLQSTGQDMCKDGGFAPTEAAA